MSPKKDGKPPMFCVVVLVYNDYPHCLDAIESVIAQTEPDFQLVIVDNGSTDITAEKIERFRQDDRVTIVRNPVNQRSDAIGTVTSETTSRYLSFLFADDTYDPSRLETAKRAFEANDTLDYLFFNSKFADEKGVQIEPGDIPPTQFSGDISVYDRFQHLRFGLLTGNTLHPCGLIIKTEIYRELGGFPKTLHRVGDLAFFTRLLGAKEGAFRPERMQKITLWTSGRNESARNSIQDNQIGLERAFILERWLEPGIIGNLGRIFRYRQAQDTKLPTRAHQIWFLAHQILKFQNPEYQLFGFRLLYESVEIGDQDFENNVIEMTGQTPSEYITRRIQHQIHYDLYPISNQDLLVGASQRRLNRLLLVLPKHIVLEVGKFLSTIGLKRVGSLFWNNAMDRIAIEKDSAPNGRR